MSALAGPPLHRAELYDNLRRGEALLLHAMAGQERLFRAGELIIIAGDRSDQVYRLRTGWLCRSRAIADGRRQIIGLFLPGDVFGVKALLYSRVPDTIECLTDATANLIDQRSVRELAAREPDVALRLMWQLAQDERRLHNWVVGLGHGSAEERIAAMLVDLHDRLRRLGLARPGSFRMPLTQQAMGDYLGMTVVHVNRVLRRLREDGIVTVRGGGVVIHDRSRLEQIAASLSDTLDREGTNVLPQTSDQMD